VRGDLGAHGARADDGGVADADHDGVGRFRVSAWQTETIAAFCERSSSLPVSHWLRSFLRMCNEHNCPTSKSRIKYSFCA
jgi:hypothetical protein